MANRSYLAALVNICAAAMSAFILQGCKKKEEEKTQSGDSGKSQSRTAETLPFQYHPLPSDPKPGNGYPYKNSK